MNDLESGEDHYSLEKIKKQLGRNNACYVLIICSAPSQKGEMQVEMFHEGDEVLAAYLIDNAQQILDDRTREKSQ